MEHDLTVVDFKSIDDAKSALNAMADQGWYIIGYIPSSLDLEYIILWERYREPADQIRLA